MSELPVYPKLKSGIFLYVLIFLISGGCCNDPVDLAGSSVDFYAIADYETMDQSMAIIENTVKLSDSLFIPYSEIFSYNPATCTFRVSNRVSESLSDVQKNPLARRPFAVVCEGEILYTGYFWYSFMSSTCDWVTIDPIDYSDNNTITVSLGYPAGFADPVDKRNHPTLLKILRRDGKLRE
jgi:hypothetical protein